MTDNLTLKFDLVHAFHEVSARAEDFEEVDAADGETAGEVCSKGVFDSFDVIIKWLLALLQARSQARIEGADVPARELHLRTNTQYIEEDISPHWCSRASLDCQDLALE